MNIQYRFWIEGEHVTVAQMAERLGTSTETMHARLRAAQKMAGPVTWARLREVSGSTYQRKGRPRAGEVAPYRRSAGR